MDIKVLIGKTVTHRRYGGGKVTDINADSANISIDFNGNTKTFPIEIINSKFFTFSDEETHKLVMMAVQKIKGTEFAENQESRRLADELTMQIKKRNKTGCYVCQTGTDNEVHIYLKWIHKSRPFDSTAKHPSRILINNRECEIVYTENHKECERVCKTINPQNYSDLISVFTKYKHILSPVGPLSMDNFPYKFAFDGINNVFGCNSLFTSDDEALVKKAYAEYNCVIDKIINQ